MDQTPTSITLNDISGSLSEMYVKLTDMSMQMDAANMQMAGIEKEVVQLIDQLILNNSPALSIPGGISANNGTANISQSALSPVYFSNTTNIYWNNPQGSDSKLDVIDGHIQDIITIMNNCGCGGTGSENNIASGINENKNDDLVKAASDDIEKNKSEGWDAINKIGTSLASGNLEKAAIDAGKATLDFSFKKIEESFDYKDRYALTTKDDRAKMDKTQALENVMNFNTTMGHLQAHDTQKSFIDGHRVFDIPLFDRDAGTQEISLNALVKAHPEVLKDQQYINTIREYLDRTGDSDLIQSAKDIGFTTEKEKKELQELMNKYRAGYNRKGVDAFVEQNLSENIGAQIKSSLYPQSSQNKQQQPIGQPHYNSELPLIISPGFDTTLNPNPTNHWKYINNRTSPQHQPASQVGRKENASVINIKIDGLIKQFTVNTTTIQESAAQIKDAVTNIMLKAVKDSKLAALA